MIRNIVSKYRALPLRQRAWIRRLLFPVFAVSRAKRECIFQIYRIAGGREIWYCTSNGISPFIMHAFFPGSCPEPAGTISIWSLPAFVRSHAPIIVDMDCFFSFLFPGAMFTFPWIRQVLDLEIPLPDILKHIHEKKYFSQYRCEISDKPEDMRYFYEEMFTPYIRERFEDCAVVLSRERIEFLFPHREVLFVTEDGHRIGGFVGMPEGDTYRFLYNAIADEELRKKGVLSCTYYFGILRAKQLGARFIDLGLSRPFLSDGVVRHKRKWRAAIQLEDQTRRRFLVSNLEKEHLIVLINGEITALVRSEDDPFIRHYADSGITFRTIADGDESLQTSPAAGT